KWEKAALEKAIDDYSNGERLWRSAGYRRKAARALSEAAKLLFILGEYRMAAASFERAAAESQRIGDGQKAAIATSYIGRIYSILGNNAEALDKAERAVDYFDQATRVNQSQ